MRCIAGDTADSCSCHGGEARAGPRPRVGVPEPAVGAPTTSHCATRQGCNKVWCREPAAAKSAVRRGSLCSQNVDPVSQEGWRGRTRSVEGEHDPKAEGSARWEQVKAASVVKILRQKQSKCSSAGGWHEVYSNNITFQN